MKALLRLLTPALLALSSFTTLANENTTKTPNKLLHEKSPYLQQHAYNPVDWYPWGDEAFEKAKKENKPVFLSIGYSTCHWCHVMEEECFEDEEVAAMMNRYFINVKVDREERPDIDAVYMDVARFLGTQGGWPLTIIMTPDKKPYAAGTYFPKYRKYNIEGLTTMLPVWYRWYRYKSNMMTDAIARVERRIAPLKKALPPRQMNNEMIDTEENFERMIGSFNPATGGFGRGGSRFPRSHQLIYLLEHYKHSSDDRALEAVKVTLERIRNGGIFDQVGYGIHRYTTDPHWFVPHFEKMLYNQALLSMALTDYVALTDDASMKLFAEQIFTYVLRDLTSPQGGFYSAEDADSPEGEGAFYIWTYEELSKLLSSKELELAKRILGVKEAGNWTDPATREEQKTNILSLTSSVETLSETEKTLLESLRTKLFEARKARIRPLLDDKILTDWNGLMIAAFAKAGDVFNNPQYTKTAVKAYDFILSKMYNDKKLLHRWRDGEAGIDGMLSDYTFMSWAALELYRSTQKIKYLGDAEAFMLEVSKLFDDGHGMYNMTSKNSKELLFNKQEFSDMATPSGNTSAFFAFSELARFTGKKEFEEKAAKLEPVISRSAMMLPQQRSIGMYTLERRNAPIYDVVVAGDPNQKDYKEMVAAIKKLSKSRMIYLVTKTAENQEELALKAPFTKNYVSKNNKATAYICINSSCLPALTTLDEVIATLTKK